MASKIVLITGANSGIGLATAKVLATATPDKYHVIVASRTLEKAQNAISGLLQEISTDQKPQLTPLQLDVTDTSSITNAVTAVSSQFGRLDVLVNNAGIGNRDHDMFTRLQTCLSVNTIGPALVSVAFRPLLLQSPHPYSIYVSSAGGSVELLAKHGDRANMPRGDAYRASKAALNMMAMFEAHEFRDTKLKVFSTCPGFVRSNLRGPSEEERTGGGKAGDPASSGNMILGIIRGERDSERWQFVHKDGVYPW